MPKLFFLSGLTLAFTQWSVSLFATSSQDLLEHNIPHYRPDASRVITFTTTRDFQKKTSMAPLRNDVLKLLKSTFDIQAFIETGTYLGDTSWEASTVFDCVYTIELSEALAKTAQKKLKNFKHTTVLQGDSTYMLPFAISHSPRPILLYLDGHWSGGVTARGNVNTPIFEELDAIKEFCPQEAIILIDDIRQFQDLLYPPAPSRDPSVIEGYPPLNLLVEAVLKINPDYQICFLADALLAFPPSSSVSVSPVVWGSAVHRLASAFPDFDEQVLKEADQAIYNAMGQEKEELITFYNTFSDIEMKAGLRSFSTLWYGLLLAKEGKIAKAQDLFEQAANNGLPGWRVDAMLPSKKLQ